MATQRDPNGTSRSPAAEHEIYTPALLRVYDPLLLGLNSHLLWRCPPRRVVAHYDRHVRARHLDVGPGSGYFLAHAALPAAAEVTLLDPNPHVLAFAARRLARLEPACVQADACEPLPPLPAFASVALSYVLHCLAGPKARKAAAIARLARVLEPDGVLFGATILGDPRRHTRLGRMALRRLQRTGAVANADETAEAVRGLLAASFDEVDLELVGAVALFAATRPRPDR